MTTKFRPALAAAAAAGMLGACASSPPPYQPTPFTPATIDTSEKIAAVDTFVVVFDASSSMAENRSEKFFKAMDTVSHLNQTVPALGYNAGLVVFGSECMLGEKLARVAYGPETYSESGFANGLGDIKCAGGPTPMARGIDLSKAEVGEAGRVALFLVSDFTKVDAKAVNKAAESFKGDLGDRLCIYPIQVGNDPKGATLAQTLASLGGCGQSVNADSLASSAAMAGYVSAALLTDAPVQPVAYVDPDSDGDGVLNDVDDCPNTPRGAKVNRRGCWILAGENVLFNFNSAEFVGDDTYLMDEAARILIANPDIKVEIMGHTDNVGNPEYNRRLSERRAQAVHDYFLALGIADERMDVRGFGADVPLVPNDTAENRALNRRVELRAFR
jgi:OOP family OmpA-OmpF porin